MGCLVPPAFTTLAAGGGGLKLTSIISDVGGSAGALKRVFGVFTRATAGVITASQLGIRTIERIVDINTGAGFTTFGNDGGAPFNVATVISADGTFITVTHAGTAGTNVGIMVEGM